MKGGSYMGTVAILFGVIIVIRPNDHNPPHVHAWYDEKQAKFSIIDGSIISGSLPSSKIKDVQWFISTYREELLKMWNDKSYSILEKK